MSKRPAGKGELIVIAVTTFLIVAAATWYGLANFHQNVVLIGVMVLPGVAGIVQALSRRRRK